jgi:NADH:ubiquinone oxidoreductase subunit 5 (subunit L)/multisubunit Na+/H+ antiporter MnhA subunit
MSADPHNQRFFSYLSMFTFFMLILVAGDNYLILFVGLFLSADVKLHFMLELLIA